MPINLMPGEGVVGFVEDESLISLGDMAN